MYTPTDKRVIKTRRQISLTLLKGQKYREALDELHQMLDLEKKAFGESSIQVAKTLNLLGSVYLSLNEVTESQSYLKQAQKIFAENGQAKTANNIKTKLKYVKDVKENKRPALKLTSVREEPWFSDIISWLSCEMGLWVVFSSVEVNDSLDDFIPVWFVLGSEVLGKLNDVHIKLLDASINIGLFRVCDWTEFMGVFDYFWEIPEFRRSFHVFNFVGVVGCFHVLELLCCLFENLVLTIFSGEHTLPDYGVFNVLVNCFIDMPEHFCAGLEYFLMFVITVIGP